MSSSRVTHRFLLTAQWIVPLASVACAALTGMLLFSLLGFDGPAVTRQIFLAPLIDPYHWPDLALQATPLILIGAGLAICFAAGVWNIGAEGHYIMGGIGATAVALWSDGRTDFWILPAMMLVGMLAGAAWASLAALLKVRLKISEVISTLMLNYIAVQVLNYLVSGPWRSPTSLGMPATDYFGPGQTLPPIIPGSTLHYGALMAVAVALLAWITMRSSLFGFFARVVGMAPRAARYSGIPLNAVVFGGLALSGALSGLAGAAEVSGSFGKLSLSFPAGHGFSAIIVVFLARCNPLALLASALVIALVRVGAELAQINTGIPSAVGSIFEVLTLVFLLMGDVAARSLTARWHGKPVSARPAGSQQASPGEALP
jgi:ABC-type uncharacterized transport system permease subunit